MVPRLENFICSFKFEGKKFLLLMYSFSGFDWEGLLVQKVVAPHVPDIKVRFMNNVLGLYFQVSKRKLL